MPSAISTASIYDQLGLPEAPIIVDVRGAEEFYGLPKLIPGSFRGHPEQLAAWARELPHDRRIAVYCTDGQGPGKKSAESLAALGYSTCFIDGGMAAWLEAGYATTKARPDLNAPGGSRWITRERPKIDRLACPWLVRRFIDPDAMFFYVPAHRVRTESETLRAQPYDIADVTFSHRGLRCSFDAFLEEFDLHDPVLERVADIIRAADTGELDRSREAPGLLAISLGLSANIADDLVLLDHAMPLYDALYAWCKRTRNETHSWPQKTQA